MNLVVTRRLLRDRLKLHSKKLKQLKKLISVYSVNKQLILQFEHLCINNESDCGRSRI